MQYYQHRDTTQQVTVDADELGENVRFKDTAGNEYQLPAGEFLYKYAKLVRPQLPRVQTQGMPVTPTIPTAPGNPIHMAAPPSAAPVDFKPLLEVLTEHGKKLDAVNANLAKLVDAFTASKPAA